MLWWFSRQTSHICVSWAAHGHEPPTPRQPFGPGTGCLWWGCRGAGTLRVTYSALQSEDPLPHKQGSDREPITRLNTIFIAVGDTSVTSALNHKCIMLEGPEDPHLRNSRFRRSRDLAHASIPLAQTPWGLTGRAWLQAGASGWSQWSSPVKQPRDWFP